MSGNLNSGLPVGFLHNQHMGQFQSIPVGWAMHQAAQQLLMQQSTALQNQIMPPPMMPSWHKPDSTQPDTLGWREWKWDDAQKCLVSPSQGTLWPTAKHTAFNWSEGDAVRGLAGIHALLVPRHWRVLSELGFTGGYGGAVTGIVERFGKYVLGTEGWRAEQVIIRELLAPSTEIGLALEARYPDVIVHYQSEEGETSCKSEKSSALEKGSRSLLPSMSIPLPLPPVQVPSPPRSPPSVVYYVDDESSPSEVMARRMGKVALIWCACMGAWCAVMAMRLFA